VSPRVLRRIVIAISIVGIGGMIAGSIADNNGTAITFGLVTAVAVLGLILVTAAAGPDAFGPGPRQEPDEAQAAALEEGIQRLVGAGADEATVREVVGRAVRLGRASRSR
jgi:hypothetical protein